MATKFGRMVTYLDDLLPLKSYDPFMTWSCKITWQIKALYLQYHSAYGHQTWHDGHLSSQASAHVVT